ncbi:hypothetical protein LCGC14_0629440 [marine sediment metagenome]|uniref:Uncharacterized protein n=1 Tax=marine sediment metagenome TaxID=412755 RepID=A0A0F9R7N2_9ZZZZ
MSLGINSSGGIVKDARVREWIKTGRPAEPELTGPQWLPGRAMQKVGNHSKKRCGAHRLYDEVGLKQTGNLHSRKSCRPTERNNPHPEVEVLWLE